MDETFDFVVIGAGALGSGSAYWLARKTPASRVLVLEQFSLGHRNGASEDHSRIIRRAYDQPHYVRLTQAMFDTWAEVEEEGGASPPYTRCGGLDLADPGGDDERVVRDTATVLWVEGIAHEWLGAEALQDRFLGFVVPPGTIGRYHPEAGVRDVGRATATQLRLARERGAEVRAAAPVTGLTDSGDHLVVATADGRRIHAGSVILCAGRWTNRLLAQVGTRLPLRYTREQVNHFAAEQPEAFSPDRIPIWIWHKEVQDGEEELYGFPTDYRGAVKVVGPCGPWVTDLPDETPIDEARTASVRKFLDTHLPGAWGPLVESRACVYELPPDHDFVLGAGHAAKFACLAGRILAELAIEGETTYDVRAFRADRPALTDPGIAPTMPGWPRHLDPHDTDLARSVTASEAG